MSYDDAPTLRPQLREILAAALAERFGDQAADPADPVVLLSPETTARADALARVTLSGRRVLDLTGGVGDVARAARRGGADLVDAVGADEELLRIARMLCVLQDVDRVSFFEGDPGLASTYADEYDVIVAFGRLPEIAAILPRIAQTLRGVLVTDLDSADDDVLAQTLPAREPLPHAGGDASSAVACAADADTLAEYLTATTSPA